MGSDKEVYPDREYVLNKHGDDLIKVAVFIESYIKKCIDIDISRTSGHKKLASTIAIKCEEGSFHSEIVSSLVNLEKQLVCACNNKIENTKKEILASLKETTKEYSNIRDKKAVSIKRICKEWEAVYSTVKVLEKKVISLSKEAEDAKKKFEDADNDMNVTKAYVQNTYNNYRDKEQQYNAALKSHQEEAKRIEDDYNKYQYETLPSIFESLQQIDLTFVKDLMSIVENHIHSSEEFSRKIQEINLSTRNQISSYNPETEIRRVLSSHIEIPLEPIFKTPAVETRKNKIMARVVYSFEPQDPREELRITEGEVITILDKSDGWWVAMNSNGEKGLIPGNYVEEIN
eukprot:GHVP01021444.1.p1 GENE.GHVP01021444.1~~GHVP01021444.1.p1  ORF type:complete len:345 (-),score=76.31 GHVP01021444.1:135-1169(-)